MTEFTGERVIPGLVDTDLLNEHLARYRFAARFAATGAVVLDAGCGSGYGTAEFREAASVIAADISADAIRHAMEQFARPGVSFLQASCRRLPFADACFDLVTAFEVIEHLEQWQELLSEARRVLQPSGVLLVSTPNRAYYAESRAQAGPNPFHCHEFDAGEFRDALYTTFPHVRIWTQNHAEAIVFAPLDPSGAKLEAGGDPLPENAHFFLAACSQAPIRANEVFAWVPSTANLLRERERHIAKLEGELAKKDAWLRQSVENLAGLQREHEQTLVELEHQNDWARRLNEEMEERSARALGWVRDLEARIEKGRLEIERLNAHREELEADLAARYAWGQSLDAQLHERSRELLELSERLQHLEDERRLIANSKWIRLGRKLNLGPAVEINGAGGE